MCERQTKEDGMTDKNTALIFGYPLANSPKVYYNKQVQIDICNFTKAGNHYETRYRRLA